MYVPLIPVTESCACMKEFYKDGVRERVVALISMHHQTATTAMQKGMLIFGAETSQKCIY